MKFYEEQLLFNAASGRLTLTIDANHMWAPNYRYGKNQAGNATEITLPEDQILMLKWNLAPTKRTNTGIWYFTRKGYAEYRDRLITSWVDHHQQKDPLFDFYGKYGDLPQDLWDKAAEKIYASIGKRLQKERKKVAKQIALLDSADKAISALTAAAP